MKTSNWFIAKKDNKIEVIYINPEQPTIPDGIDKNSLMPLGEVTKAIKDNSSKIPRTQKGEILLCIAQLLSDVLSYGISGNGERMTLHGSNNFTVIIELVGQTIKIGSYVNNIIDLCNPNSFEEAKNFILEKYLNHINRDIIEDIMCDEEAALRIVLNEAEVHLRKKLEQRTKGSFTLLQEELDLKKTVQHYSGYMRTIKLILNKLNGPIFKVSNKLGMVIKGPHGACFRFYSPYHNDINYHFGNFTSSFNNLFEIDNPPSPFFDKKFGDKLDEIRALVVPIMERYKAAVTEKRPLWDEFKPEVRDQTDKTLKDARGKWDEAVLAYEEKYVTICLAHMDEMIKILDEKGYFDVRQLAD